MKYIILATGILVAALIVLFLIMRKEKKEDGQKEKRKSRHVSRSTMELLRVRSYDRDRQYYIMSDGSIMDMLQINTKDITSASQDELEYDCLKLGKLYKTYAGDMKIISMNFPCNTSAQQMYFRDRIRKAKNSIFEQWLQIRLRELENLEKTNTTREFYFMFFSNSPEEHEKNKNTFLITLSSGRDGLISPLTEEKKHQILYKLNNKNSMIMKGSS